MTSSAGLLRAAVVANEHGAREGEVRLTRLSYSMERRHLAELTMPLIDTFLKRSGFGKEPGLRGC